LTVHGVALYLTPMTIEPIDMTHAVICLVDDVMRGSTK
jgi:hypothetical protein